MCVCVKKSVLLSMLCPNVSRVCMGCMGDVCCILRVCECGSVEVCECGSVKVCKCVSVYMCVSVSDDW